MMISEELKGHLGHLDEHEEKKLQEFKNKVEALFQGEEQRKWYDDATLLRFLRARNFDVQGAFKQFSLTNQWRKEKDLDNMYDHFDVQKIEDAKSILPQWTGRTDKMGRGIYVYKVAATVNGQRTSEILKAKVEDRYDSIAGLTEMLHRFIFPLLSSIPSASSPTPISSCTTITDLDSASLKALWNLRNHVQSASGISSSHYPETSCRIIIVNSPAFMSIVYGWLKKLLDPGTVSKILILGSDPKKELLELIDEEQLPAAYGGKLDWSYGDEPDLQPAIREIIGEKLPPGPLALQDSKLILLGKRDSEVGRS